MSMHTRPWREEAEAAERRTVSLSLDAELLSAAKAMDIDLIHALEEALRTKLGHPAGPAPAEPAPAEPKSGW